MVYQKKNKYKASQSIIDFENVLFNHLNRIGLTISQISEPGLASISKAATLHQQVQWLEIILMPFLTREDYLTEKQRLTAELKQVTYAENPQRLVQYVESLSGWAGLLMAYAYNLGLVKVDQYDTSALDDIEKDITVEE